MVKTSSTWKIGSDFQGSFRGAEALGRQDIGGVWLCFEIKWFNPFDPPVSLETWLWRMAGCGL